MANNKIPKAVNERFHFYIKIAKKFKERGYYIINSKEFADEFTDYKIDSSTVRRDINYLGKIGRQGYGYNIDELISKLTIEIGIGNHEDIILFGVGNMGKALLKYNLMSEKIGSIIAAFDVDVVEKEIDGIPIYDYKDYGVKYFFPSTIAIIAVPTSAAQEVVEKVIANKCKAIINFSDVDLIVKSKKVILKNVDLSYFIQEVIYNLKINQLN